MSLWSCVKGSLINRFSKQANIPHTNNVQSISSCHVWLKFQSLRLSSMLKIFNLFQAWGVKYTSEVMENPCSSWRSCSCTHSRPPCTSPSLLWVEQVSIEGVENRSGRSCIWKCIDIYNISIYVISISIYVVIYVSYCILSLVWLLW